MCQPWPSTKCPHLSPVRWGENRMKERGFADQDNSNSVEKGICANKTRRETRSLVPSSKEKFSHLLESRAWACIPVSWEVKYYSHKYLSFILLSFLVNSGHLSLSNIWPTPSLHLRGERCRVECERVKALTLCNHCTEIDKILLLSGLP